MLTVNTPHVHTDVSSPRLNNHHCFNKWLIWPHARNFVYYNYWILKSREINKKSKEEQKHPEAHRLFFIACAGISLPVSILQSHLAWKRASLSHKIPSNLISLWALCVAAKADRDLSPLWVLLLSCITKKRAGKSTCKDVRTVSVKRELEHTSANPLVVLYLAIKHAYTHTHTLLYRFGETEGALGCQSVWRTPHWAERTLRFGCVCAVNRQFSPKCDAVLKLPNQNHDCTFVDSLTLLRMQISHRLLKIIAQVIFFKFKQKTELYVEPLK